MLFDDEARAEAIREIYKDVLKRDADDAGLMNYYNSPLPVESIRDALSRSPEAHSILRKASQIIEAVEPWLGAAALNTAQSFERAMALGFNRVLCLHDDTELEKFLPEGSKFIELKREESLGVGLLIEAVKLLKQWSEEPNTRVLVNCHDGVTHSAGVIWMWYIHNGLADDEAAQLVRARLDGANLEATRLGPWHFDAALTLEGF